MKTTSLFPTYKSIKRHTLLLSFLLCAFLSSANNKLDSLLDVLDKTILEYQTFVDIRENRIQHLKGKLNENNLSLQNVYSLNLQLFKEYKPYICDSAISYLNKNMDIAESLDDDDRITETRLLLSYYLTSTGVYKESMDILDAIDRKTLKPKFLIDYYNAYAHAYGELSTYAQDKKSGAKHLTMSKIYKDSLFSIIPPESEQYLKLKEYNLFSMRKYQEALDINTQRLSKVKMGTADYALVTYYRSLYYGRMKNADERKKFLALSAISDTRAAIMDNASLWALADSLYSTGDVNRAYNYIRHSLDNANCFNARLRSFQISGIQSIINKTYQTKSEQQKEKLQFYLILISLLSVLLVAAILCIYMQIKKISAAKNYLQEANEQLKGINLKLSESNLVKEEYIGHFLALCSTYINKLESFRKLVHKRVTLKQMDELYKLTKSDDWMEKELKEFYTNFDSTFLHLYPNFVQEFNALLIDEEKIVLKKGELFNTELRIFALIRLGIDDSSKIASFLGYSVHTIYNYRAKVKSKTRGCRDDFENQVLKIGAPTE